MEKDATTGILVRVSVSVNAPQGKPPFDAGVITVLVLVRVDVGAHDVLQALQALQALNTQSTGQGVIVKFKVAVLHPTTYV